MDDIEYDGELTEVPLLWLMRNITHSCDGFDLDTFEGWQDMFLAKCSDTGFGHLVESIMERGFLPGGAIGFDDGEITEGHHRLCAAILLCLDTVWISCWGKDIFIAPGDKLARAHWSDDAHPILVMI